MKIRTFFYTIKQGVVNLYRNKWYSLASIATIAACLFMFGIFYAIVANFQHMVKVMQEDVSITVFFDEGIEQTRVEEIGKLIAARTEEVARMRFVSAEEAWAWYQQEYFGDQREEFLEGYPTNPLADSFNYEVFLKDVSKQEQLITYIESIPGVRHVNSDTVAHTLSGVNLLISYVSIGIIIILLAVSVFLISNTVTVGISVRQEEINIMKYIGATDYLVRAPFIIEGMLIGLIGAIIPLLIIHNMYSEVLGYIMERFTMLSQLLAFLPVETIYDFLLPVSLIVGVGIGFLGSVTTVRKHINV